MLNRYAMQLGLVDASKLTESACTTSNLAGVNDQLAPH